MNLYRIYSIKDVFMKQFSPDLRKVAAPFFHLQSLFSNLHIENLYMSTNHINSILIDEEGLFKIQDFSKSKFGKQTSIDDISKEACVYNKDEFTKFEITNPHDVTTIIKNHMRQEHIQDIIKNKKESLREAAVKKEILRSRIYNDHDHDFYHKKTVSIDFEYINLDVFEFGVSIYEEGKQTSFHYLIEENYVNKKTKPELQFMFNFGETEIIKESAIESILKQHISGADYLLLHGHSNDYLILRKYGLDMEQETHMKIMDTILYYKKHFVPTQGDALTLKRMLHIFNLEPLNMHNSGNDADFTLKLFIDMYNQHEKTLDLKLKCVA
jgi:hypothetical protein